MFFVIWIFCSVSNDVIGDTAAREIFPTAVRATAAGVCAIAHTLGGSIGLAGESALFAAFGSRVTLVELLPRMLPLEDEEVSAELEKAFRKRKIRVLTGVELKAVERGESAVRVQLVGEGMTLMNV